MVKEQAHHIDISAIPELVRMAEEVQRTKTRALLARNDEVLAEIDPAPSPNGTARRFQHGRGGQLNKQSPKALVDTSALPPVPYTSLDDLLTRVPGTAPRSFTDEEIREEVDLDLAEA
jgi:hypothetical protein